MGLDMYAMITSEQPKKPVDFNVENADELHYWRKHPDLHGWMERLYYDKGGKEEFNCVPVVLDKADLTRLEADIRAGQLPDTEGFYFGRTQGDESADDLDFITKARQAILEGYTVFYDCWW